MSTRRDTALSMALFLPSATALLAIGINKASDTPLMQAMGLAAGATAVWWAVAHVAAALRRLRR